MHNADILYYVIELFVLQCQFSSFARNFAWSKYIVPLWICLQGVQTLFWKFSQILKSSVDLCTRPDRRCLPLASHCVIKVNCSSAKEATKTKESKLCLAGKEGGNYKSDRFSRFCTNQNLHGVCLFRLYVPQNHIPILGFYTKNSPLNSWSPHFMITIWNQKSQNAGTPCIQRGPCLT